MYIGKGYQKEIIENVNSKRNFEVDYLEKNFQLDYQFIRPMNPGIDSNLYIITGVCPRYKDGRNLKPFYSKLLLGTGDVDACQTSHNFHFIEKLIDHDTLGRNAYLNLNIDNPTLNCINVIVHGVHKYEKSGKKYIDYVSHCPAAPVAAYHNELIETFFNSILKALLHTSLDIQNMFTNQKVYCISFSVMFSTNILQCSYRSEEWRTYKFSSYNIKCIGTPHFCHIGGALLSYTFEYLVNLIYETRRKKHEDEEIKDVLCGLCCEHKVIKQSSYKNMNKYHIMYYFCDKLLKYGFYNNKISTEEIATNEMIEEVMIDGKITLKYKDKFQFSKYYNQHDMNSKNMMKEKKSKFTWSNDHHTINKRRQENNANGSGNGGGGDDDGGVVAVRDNGGAPVRNTGGGGVPDSDNGGSGTGVVAVRDNGGIGTGVVVVLGNGGAPVRSTGGGVPDDDMEVESNGDDDDMSVDSSSCTFTEVEGK